MCVCLKFPPLIFVMFSFPWVMVSGGWLFTCCVAIQWSSATTYSYSRGLVVELASCVQMVVVKPLITVALGIACF